MSLSGKLFKLNNGNTIPAIGFGVGTAWYKLGENKFDANVVKILDTALKHGFTHIDGAENYRTNEELGKAIANYKRENLFITSKYNTGNGSPGTGSTAANPYEALKNDLKTQLNTPYVDLYLLHSPFIEKSVQGFDVVEAWQHLEKLVADGLAKTIGVSNFRVEDLQKILNSDPKIKPAVHQIEFSPYLQDQTPGIVEFTQKEGILIEAYSPLGPLSKGKPGPIDSTLQKLVQKYNKAEEQILLRWTLQKGILPITTTSKEERIKKFLDIFDFELTADEVDEISKLGKGKTVRQYWVPQYSKYD